MKKKALIYMVAILCFMLVGCKSKEAKATEKLIDAIGTVTLESGEAISIAEQSYSALSPDDKSAVSDAKQRLDGYRADYNLLSAIDELDDTLQNIESEITINLDPANELNTVNTAFNTDNKTLTVSCVMDIDDEELEQLKLLNIGKSCSDTTTEYADAIKRVLDNHQVKDIQVLVQLLTADETIVLTEALNGKVTKNVIQDYIDAKPSTRDNTDFELACWGDDKKTVLNYIKETVWDMGDMNLTLFDHTVFKKKADVQYRFNSAEQLYEVVCVFTQNNISAGNCILEYENIKKTIVAEYGEPTEDKVYKLDSLANYADASTALQLGYSAYRTIWETDSTELHLIMSRGDSYKITTSLFYESKTVSKE